MDNTGHEGHLRIMEKEREGREGNKHERESLYSFWHRHSDSVNKNTIYIWRRGLKNHLLKSLTRSTSKYPELQRNEDGEIPGYDEHINTVL